MSHPTIQINNYLRPGTIIGRSAGAFAPASVPLPKQKITPVAGTLSSFSYPLGFMILFNLVAENEFESGLFRLIANNNQATDEFDFSRLSVSGIGVEPINDTKLFRLKINHFGV